MMKVLVVSALLLALTGGVALALNEISCAEVGNPCLGTSDADTIDGTLGDNVGQDTIIGFEGGDTLYGESAGDQLLGGGGADTLRGGAGNDTLDGGPGKDNIYTGSGFDFVYAKDGYADYINCNGEGGYYIVRDRNLDTLDECPSTSAQAASAADGGGSTVNKSVVLDY